MNSKEYMEKTEQYVLHTYNRFPVVLEKGDGVYLTDADGKSYLDFGAGIAVFALGYGNKAYNDALKKQIDQLIHTSNLYYNIPLEEAAEKLIRTSGMDKVFFTNSGTEAIEGAIKAARKYAWLKDGGTDHEIVAMNHSFHGRSVGALSVTGNAHYQEPFRPLMGGVKFADFNDYTLMDTSSVEGINKKVFYDKNRNVIQTDELFDAYLKYGGMPPVIDAGLNQEKAVAVLDGVYSAVVVRDILEREKRKDQRATSDAVLLRKLIMFLADNIGNNTSATSIGNTLMNEGLLENRVKKPATHTIQAYIGALTESYIFYEIKRFDIKGKEYLRTLGKYYIVDIGLRNYLLGFRSGDTGHILENVVFFELLRRGYDVAIGKIDNKEVDFIATKTDEKKYIQVTESMTSEETRKRELAPLEAIHDNYEKIVLTRDKSLFDDYNGIKVVNVIDFLLK